MITSFDVSKDWIILIPENVSSARKAAEDLCHYINLLRKQSNFPEATIPIKENISDNDMYPILLNIFEEDKNNWEKNGFSWRIGKERIEINGESDRGIFNGIYNFLSAVGFSWSDIDQETLPPINKESPYEYLLKESYAYHPSSQDTIRRRLLIGRQEMPKNWKSLIYWAVRNQIDIVVLSLQSIELKSKDFFQQKTIAKQIQSALDLLKEYALDIEFGGWDLSILVPRNFFSNKEILRIDAGKRDRKHNFCPTAPETIKLIKSNATKFFKSHPEVRIYHFWPDQGYEKAWCSCPTCRAFTIEEQNRIAVNAVADALEKVNPKGRISYYENPPRKESIALRSLLFRVNCLPGEAEAETNGWFLPPPTNLS